MTQRARPRRGDVPLLKSRKGAFILFSDSARKIWALSDALFTGSDVFHLVFDPREEGTLVAAVNSPIWEPEVQISCDLGQSCHGSAEGPKFNGDSGSAVRRVWNIASGSATNGDRTPAPTGLS